MNNKYSKAYFEAFVFSLLIVWLPFKILGYLTPFIFVAYFILRANSGKYLLRSISLIVTFSVIVLLYFSFYSLVGEDFIIQNALLSFLTYGSFLIIFLVPRNIIIDGDHQKYFTVIKWVILIESFIGIAQVVIFVLLYGGNFDLAAGDMAQGTLNLTSFANPGGNFNNQIYTCNLLLLLVFYSAYALSARKNIWVCFVAIAAIFLASVWHMLIAFIISVILISVFFKYSLQKLSFKYVLGGFALLVVLLLSLAIQPKNFSLISHYYSKVRSNESPKALVALSSITSLPKEFPFVYLTGLGPGQYSSRAGLIGTERYFGEFSNPKELPIIEPRYSKAFDNYVYPKWYEVSTQPETYGDSTMARPFFSILSILIEFGLIFFIIVAAATLNVILRLRKNYISSFKRSNRLVAFCGFSCAVSISYLFMIGLFENYLEVAHAIFIGLVLVKYFSSYVKYSNV